MNADDENLKQALAHLRVPSVDDAKREQALQCALAHLRATKPPLQMPAARRVPFALMGMVGAAACLVLAMVWWLQPRHSDIAASDAPSGASPFTVGMFAEVQQLFPRHLQAVICDGTNVDVELSDAPVEMADDQRIKVTFQRKGRSCSVFTFSGRNVCLELDGKQLCFTPLIQGDGSVFVLQDDAAILSSGGVTADGFRISAKTLTEGVS